MILYDPIQGDVLTRQIKFLPQTCFIMTQLGTPIPKEIKNIRITLEKYLKKNKILKFLDGINEQAEYYFTTSELLEGNPLLSIDYLRRAFLITGNNRFKKKAQILSDANPFDKQTQFGIKSFLKFKRLREGSKTT